MNTLAMNDDVMMIVLQKWIPQLDKLTGKQRKLKTLNINQVKAEARHYLTHYLIWSIIQSI